jgi:hypothetical protein
MTHKDWEGPGFYKRWDSDGEYIGEDEFKIDCHMTETFTYRKVKPSILPKKKLPAGLYQVINYRDLPAIQMFDGRVWRYCNGSDKVITKPKKIIGLILIKSIDQKEYEF